ncbi:hypothetical protein FKR81_22835 [Lentzea tibetensis]|uniref:Cell wall hydrolase SleB domain-containing protein n=1 Tax=Lentzea tibetensis TaxID=2591470 RepID=A0A563EQV9_9PSEU|nr:hypothetical protein [Lentzea tibetensis]TWP50061.1 hypothetical protein FKR81_22835 [Lentzea tibetensis]
MRIRIAALVLAIAIAGTGLTSTGADAGADLGCPAFATPDDEVLVEQLAERMTGLMRTHLRPATVACARAVVLTVEFRGLPEHAATIAITTAIVETYVRNLDHGHGSSVGLFQQINSWGTFEERTDPVWATDAFLEEMVQLYPDDSWTSPPVGEVCQEVQRSGYPERYEPEAGDGRTIARALWRSTAAPER